MEPYALFAGIITLLAPVLSILAKSLSLHRNKRRKQVSSREEDIVFYGAEPPPPPTPPASSGIRVLLVFAVIVVVFGAAAAARYWELIKQSADLWFFAAGLVLTMAGGMFVQVLAANYRAGRGLFEVTASQLIFPLLFALIVFYPIWALAASSPKNLFSFYAAFLNGYFWESVVSAARRPTASDTGIGT